MARSDKLSTYRTTFEQDGERGSVTYVSTRIVAWDGDIVTLNSGGWQTVTTKRKMCQAANQFGLRFCVFQRKGEWFVDIKASSFIPNMHWAGMKIPFKDGMKFNKYTGEIVS